MIAHNDNKRREDYFPPISSRELSRLRKEHWERKQKDWEDAQRL